jgi:peroxiredoxin
MSRENEILNTGDRAPDFMLPDAASGDMIRLADLLGKPLMIYFGRGTW